MYEQPMKRSVTLGAIVGTALGAVVTLALSRGWLELPWGESPSAEIAAPQRAGFELSPSDGDDVRSATTPARPLRPGGLQVGDLAAGLPRS
jgi:hypothetical protein